MSAGTEGLSGAAAWRTHLGKAQGVEGAARVDALLLLRIAAVHLSASQCDELLRKGEITLKVYDAATLAWYVVLTQRRLNARQGWLHALQAWKHALQAWKHALQA